jgi:hypothetical protein
MSEQNGKKAIVPTQQGNDLEEAVRKIPILMFETGSLVVERNGNGDHSSSDRGEGDRDGQGRALIESSGSQIVLEPVEGLQGFLRFMRTVKPIQGSSEIWFKTGHSTFWKGEFNGTGVFDLYRTVKPKKSASVDRQVENRSSGSVYDVLRTVSERQGEMGVFYLPSQPQGNPLRECVEFTDTISVEFDHHSRETQFRLIQQVEQWGLIPAAIVGSGGKSLHVHYKLDRAYPIENVLYLRRLLTMLMQSDPAVIHPHQPMRIPGFYRGDKGAEQTLLFTSSAAYHIDAFLSSLKIGFVTNLYNFPEELPIEFFQEILRAIKRIYADKTIAPGKVFKAAKEAIRKTLAIDLRRKFEDIENRRKTRDSVLKGADLGNNALQESVFNQVIAIQNKVNIEAKLEDFGNNHGWMGSTEHMRGDCTHHDSTSHNSAWLECNELGYWRFHCPHCTGDHGYSLVQYRWAVHNNFEPQPIAKGEEWFTQQKQIHKALGLDLTVFDGNLSDQVQPPKILSDHFFDYLINYDDPIDAVFALSEVAGEVISERQSDRFVQTTLYYVANLTKDESILRRIGELLRITFNTLRTIFTPLLKKALNVQKRRVQEEIKKVTLPDKAVKLKGDTRNHAVLDEIANSKSVFYTRQMNSASFVLHCDIYRAIDYFLEFYKGSIFFEDVRENYISAWFYQAITWEDRVIYVWKRINRTDLKARLNAFCQQYLIAAAHTIEYDYWKQCGGLKKMLEEFENRNDRLPRQSGLFLPHTQYIGFTNGLLNVKTKKLVPYDSSIHNVLVFPFDYETIAAENEDVSFFTEYLRGFLTKTTDDVQHEDKINTLLNLIAAAVTMNGHLAKKFLWFYGDSNAGKSTFVDGLETIFDDFSSEFVRQDPYFVHFKHDLLFARVPARQLFGDQDVFARAAYEGKGIMYCDEANSNFTVHMAENLKNFSNPFQKMSVQQKFEPAHDIYQLALHIFSGQVIPDCLRDKGLSNRIVPFQVQKNQSMWAEYSARIGKFDFRVNLINFLTSLDFIGFMNDRRNKESEWEIEEKRSIEFQTDYNATFIQDCLIVTNNEEDYEMNSVLLNALFYYQDCTMKTPNNRILGRDLQRRLKDSFGYQFESKVIRLGDKTVRVYPGLRLRSWDEIVEHFRSTMPKFQDFMSEYFDKAQCYRLTPATAEKQLE